MYNAIICRYHEIAIKGNNRSMFEKRMVENIHRLLRSIANLKISRVRGRIWIEHKDGNAFDPAELETAEKQLTKAFGLESFSPVIMCKPDMVLIKQAVDDSCRTYFEQAFARQAEVSFRIRATRSNKLFPLDSKQIEIALAEVAAGKYDHSKLNVDLKSADVSIYCEVRHEFAFVYYETFRGPGGLPVGSNSPVLALLSGGIVSPVACYLAMKRGCRVDFITFHSAPYTPPETFEKVKRVATLINTFQLPGRLHICNLAPVQKLIRDKCTPRFRTVLYRRMMFRIAETVARRTRRMALLTGEAVGQVASQTVINMATINAATDMLVLRPLVGTDKNDAVVMSRRMGAFDISIEQVPDSCTVFAPKSPATSAPQDRIIEEEDKIPEYKELLEEIINEIEIFEG